MTIEAILCGRNLGKHGSCDNVSGHSGSCSSPELKAYRRAAVAKTREKQKTVDDSVLDEECDHKSCVEPCMFAGVPYPSRTERARAEELKAQEAVAEEVAQARRVRKAEEERFIGEVLNRYDAGETIDHETQAMFLAAVISYLGLPSRFTLDRDTRIRRELDLEGRLSEVLFGPSYTGLYKPIVPLDERSLLVRLGRFLNVADQHSSLNTPTHPDMKRKSPDVPLPPLGLPPVFTPGPPPGL